MTARCTLRAVTVAALVFASMARAEHRRVPVMRMQTETEAIARPGVVWSHLTTDRNLVTW